MQEVTIFVWFILCVAPLLSAHLVLDYEYFPKLQSPQNSQPQQARILQGLAAAA